jgi:hypothetical protein
MTQKDIRSAIEAANHQVMQIMLGSRPVWTDVLPALDALPGMTKRTILHAGPPIPWSRMCEAQRNGVINGILYESLAETSEEALRLVEDGSVTIAPCHEYGAVGGMAGITTASMPLVQVRNEASGNVGYSQLFQGPGTQDWRRGEYSAAAIRQWRYLRTVLGPALQAAIRLRGSLDVKSLMAKALQMGDECHNRNVAGSALLIREITPFLLRAGLSGQMLLDSMDYLARADQFSLTLAMAAAKATVESAKGVAYSTIVTTMCRNGTDFGIRVSGLGDAWFTAPANPVQGLFFSSEWKPEDAALDMGDSAIMETVGLGGFVQAAAPALQQFVGGSFRRALDLTREMREITAGVNRDYQLPNLDFEGAPTGIDIRKVVQTGITPIIDTAIGHRAGGVIGAGQVRAPLGCFKKALESYGRKYLARPAATEANS